MDEVGAMETMPYHNADRAREEQARALASSLDQTAAELDRDGPVPASHVRARLEQLLDEAGETAAE